MKFKNLFKTTQLEFLSTLPCYRLSSLYDLFSIWLRCLDLHRLRCGVCLRRLNRLKCVHSLRHGVHSLRHSLRI